MTKRGGRVEVVDKNTFKFTAEVFDAQEMLPWLRTFIGRIQELKCNNRAVQERFYMDLAEMNRLYGGEDDAVQ